MKEIYLDELNLEGELVLEGFTYEYLRICISPQVNKNKLTIKNFSKHARIINCKDAQKYINQNYLTKENREKIEKLDMIHENLGGNLDLSDFVNLKEIRLQSLHIIFFIKKDI